MSLHLYRRMRRFPERFRHSRRAKPGNVPSTFDYRVTRSHNKADGAIYSVVFSIDGGALVGQDSTNVAPGKAVTDIATQLATDWGANLSLTVTNPTPDVVRVAATSGTLTSCRVDTRDTTSVQ